MSRRNDDRDQGAMERMGEQIGGAAGRAVGRGTEMAANAMTSMLGSAMDSLGDWWSSSEAREAADSFNGERDRTCRSHFEGEGAGEGEGSTPNRHYDDVRPLYQFGHMAGQNPDYQGRSFEEVEPDLQRAWDDDSRESPADWPEVRGYVGFGYSQE